jgi:hypothetical protein
MRCGGGHKDLRGVREYRIRMAEGGLIDLGEIGNFMNLAAFLVSSKLWACMMQM